MPSTWLDEMIESSDDDADDDAIKGSEVNGFEFDVVSLLMLPSNKSSDDPDEDCDDVVDKLGKAKESPYELC